MVMTTNKRTEMAEGISRCCCGNSDNDDNNQGKATREGASRYCRCDCKGNNGKIKERQGREGAHCRRRTTCNSQQKKATIKEQFVAVVRTATTMTATEDKQQKKEIVAVVVELETAMMATK